MAEPVLRSDAPGGGKVYTHPLTFEVFDSVTSALEPWDKDGLLPWAANLAVDEMADLLPQLLVAQLMDNCGNTFNRCYLKHGQDATCERCPCRRCTRCLGRRAADRHWAEKTRRGREGTEVHEAIEYWVLHAGDLLALRKETQPYFDQFLRWVTDYGLTPNTRDGQGSWEQTECTLINRQYGYAGTSDAAVWIARGTPRAGELLDGFPSRPDRALVRVDYKTREKPDEQLYNDHPLQGVAYESCPTALLPDGQELPAPSTAARMVLQLRPPGEKTPQGSYTFTPMRSGEREFQVFLGLLDAYRWRRDFGGKKAFGLTTIGAEEREMAAAAAAPDPEPWSQDPDPAPGPPAVSPEPVSATLKVDPFTLASAAVPAVTGAGRQRAAAAMSGRSGKSPFPVGDPVLESFDEHIPF